MYILHDLAVLNHQSQRNESKFIQKPVYECSEALNVRGWRTSLGGSYGKMVIQTPGFHTMEPFSAMTKKQTLDTDNSWIDSRALSRVRKVNLKKMLCP